MIASSYSRMKVAECPFRFKSLYIDKFKEPESEASKRGSEVHDAIAGYLRHCLVAGKSADTAYLSALSVSDEAKEILEKYVTTPYAVVPIGADWIAVESQMAFDKDLNPLVGKDGWFSRDCAWRMVVDLAYVLDGALHVVDWKTGFGGGADPVQTRIYGWLAYKHYLAIANGKSTPANVNATIANLTTMQHATESWPADEGKSIEEILFKHLEEINSWTEYPAVPCSQCKWCSVPGCPIREAAVDALVEERPGIVIPHEIVSRDQAEMAVLFLMFVDGVTSRVSDLLRSWVHENGPVAAGGKIAEERENKPWKPIDAYKIAKGLRAYGVQPETIWEHVAISESGLEKICKAANIRDKLPLLLSMGRRIDYKPKFGLYVDKL